MTPPDPLLITRDRRCISSGLSHRRLHEKLSEGVKRGSRVRTSSRSPRWKQASGNGFDPRECCFSSEAVVQRRVRCAMEVALWQRCVGSGYAREPGIIDMLAAMWNALGWEPDHG